MDFECWPRHGCADLLSDLLLSLELLEPEAVDGCSYFTLLPSAARIQNKTEHHLTPLGLVMLEGIVALLVQGAPSTTQEPLQALASIAVDSAGGPANGTVAILRVLGQRKVAKADVAALELRTALAA